MTNNPYDVLGVTENATLEEIKNAYRTLVRKYHPDNFSDSSLAASAAEKMKKINIAYDEIIVQRRSSTAYNASSPTSFADVRKLIHAGRIADAQQLLDGIPAASRTAEWYFLKGTVFMRRGWMDQAYSCYEQATQMEPGNSEYRSALEYISRRRNGESGGYNTSRRAARGSGCGNCCDTCCALWCADSCCECCGGDFISCC